MKPIIHFGFGPLVAVLGLAAPFASAAVTFDYLSFGTVTAAQNLTEKSATLTDGALSITATVRVSGSGVLVTNDGGSVFTRHLGVVAASTGPTLAIDENTAANQGSRIANGQALSFSFSQDVYLDVITVNNLLSGTSAREVMNLSTNGTAFNGLSGYGNPVSTASPQYGGLGTFGYNDTTDTFAISTVTFTNEGNIAQPIRFDIDGLSRILLPAGNTITISGSVVSNGGFGLNGITVTAVPEASHTMLAGLGAVAVAFRRRRK